MPAKKVTPAKSTKSARPVAGKAGRPHIPPATSFPRRAAAPSAPKPVQLRTAVERSEPAAPSHLLKLASPTPGEIKTVEAEGPVLFLGAQVVMGNAAAGVSQVGLEIDGQLVTVLRPDQATARGLNVPNATGAFATHASFGNLWTLVLGWPYPLKVARQIKLSVMVMETIGELEMTLFLGR
jgi:hypothetical protein